MTSSQTKRLVVLLVEDDVADQELIRRSLSRRKFFIDLHIAENGEEGLDFLHRRGRFAEDPACVRPHLILLDLNMPRVCGRQVLERLRDDTTLSHIPVTVLTTSDHEADILRSYDLGCHAYIAKPTDLDEFDEQIGSLVDYWYDVATSRRPAPSLGAWNR